MIKSRIERMSLPTANARRTQPADPGITSPLNALVTRVVLVHDAQPVADEAPQVEDVVRLLLNSENETCTCYCNGNLIKV